jgi:hypothetical protein
VGPLRASGPRGQALVLEGHRVTQRALPLLSALDGVPGVATLSDLGGPARLLDSP